MTKIEDGELFYSKLDDYAIYRYTRDGEQIAVTLSQSTRSCGRILFRTGIPDIFVVLIEDHEHFLENDKLRLMEYNEGLFFEAEIRGTMNSLKLSTDMLYKDINFRICQAQRQQIITSQALLRKNLEP